MTSVSRQSVRDRAMARVGTVVQKYRITELLGVGGMAAVYAATHRNGHRVAIKLMLDHLSDDYDIQQLFSREAYVANRVGHPGAVPVLDDDVEESGRPFLIMPLLEGETLRARWERYDHRLPVAEVSVLMADTLDVLARAHANGIVHRDIKPENLFVTTVGAVRVLDFGIARRLDAAWGATAGSTLTAHIIGTPAFIPPEQALGNRAGIGPHSDCWAVGATMFTLLSGEPVHPADSAPAQLAAAATKPARSLGKVVPALPSALIGVVDKALAFHAKDRWATAKEMRDALLAAFEEISGEPFAAAATRIHAELALELSARVDAARVDEVPPTERDRPLSSADTPTRPPVMEGRFSRERSPSGKSLPPPRGGELPTMMAGVATPSSRGTAMAPRLTWRKALAPALAIVVGSVTVPLVYRTVAHSPGAPPVAVADAEPETPPGNPEAMVPFNVALQSWRDASEHAAARSFTRALEIDPSLAAAHLYLAMLPTWTDDSSRAHHHAAAAQRTRLGARDRALLEAYAPAMALPPDLETSEQRLQAARASFPNDWLVLYALADTQIKRGELTKAIAVLDELLRHEPQLAMAWRDRGLAFALLDDEKSATTSLGECLRISAYAETCLELTMKLHANEGRCAEAERYGRMLMAVPSPRGSSAVSLAAAIHGRGGAVASVQDVLGQAWQLVPQTARETVRLQNDTHWKVLTGAFSEAERAAAAWTQSVASARYEDEHGEPSSAQLYIAMELGQTEQAALLAKDFLEKRDAWLSSTYFDWEIVPLRVQYLTGTLPRATFEQRRHAWLLRQSARPHLVDSPNLRWALAYALAVATREDAIEALRVLPEYLPITDALSREVYLDDGIGYSYLLSGDAEKALPYLRRASNSCRAIQYPFEHTWAHLHLGMAQEQMGDVAGACAAYGVVLSRWGKEGRSISAKAARAHRAALKCAAVP